MKKVFYLFTIFAIILNVNILYARNYTLTADNLENIEGSNTWIGWKVWHFGATTPISKKGDEVEFRRAMIDTNGNYTTHNTTVTVDGYGHYGLSFSKQLLGLLAYIKNNSTLDYDTEYIPIYDQPQFDESGNLIEPAEVKLKAGIDITIGKMIRTWYSEDYEEAEFKDFWEKSFTSYHYTDLKEIQNKFYWNAYGKNAYRLLTSMIGSSLTAEEEKVLRGVVLSLMEARYRNKDVNGKMQLQIKVAEGDISPFLVSLENLGRIHREGSGGYYTYKDVNKQTTYYEWPKLENGHIDFDKIIDNAYMWMVYYEKDSLRETTHTTITQVINNVEEDVEIDWEGEYWDLTGSPLPTLSGKALEEFYSRCQKVRSLFKKSKENTEGIFGSEELYDISSDINYGEAIKDMKQAMVDLANGAGKDVRSIFSGLDSEHIARTYLMAKNIVETNRIKNEYAYYDIGLNIISYTPGLDTGEIMLMDFQKIKLKSPLTVKVDDRNYKTYEDTDNDGIYDREELGDELSDSDRESSLKKKVDVSGFIRKAVERELYGNNDSEIRANKEYIDEVVAKVKYNIYNQRNKFDKENAENNKLNWKEVYENNLNVDDETKAALDVMSSDTAKQQYLKLSPSKLEVELWKYKSNPTLKDTDFDGIDDGIGKVKLREVERTYGLTEDDEDDIKVRENHCKLIPSSVINTLKKDKVPKDNHFTGRMNTSRLSGSNGIEVDMNMDYRYFFLSNKLYYDELSTMSLLYANSIYRKDDNQPMHSGLQVRSANNFVNEYESFTRNGVQSMSIEKFKNLPVKEMMEHFGFQNVRTYYMGSPGDEGDENKEHFAGFRNTDTGNMDIPASEIDTSYSNMIYSTGHRRIGTKYRNIDEIYLGYKDTHKGRVAIGYRTIEYHGIYKTVVGIVIRGTAEDDDWDSDFDMGDKKLKEKLNYRSGIDNYKDNYDDILSELNTGILNYDSQYSQELLHFAGGYPDWTHTQHHAGFDIVANRILEVIDNYYNEVSVNFDSDIEILDENTIETAITANSISNYSSDLVDGGVCFWVTGHSMGAGVANLVAANLIDKGYRDNVYCYTFAAPNTFYWSDNKEDNYREPKGVNYRCIFNIVNDDDFVPKLPMEKCEWTKYGRTGNVSINNIQSIMYNNYINYRIGTIERYITDKYHTNPKSVENIITGFENLYNDKSNMRKESYEFIEDGESSFADYDYEDDLKEVVGYYAKPYQKYSWDQCSTGEYYYRQQQMPAYFMQTITNSLHYVGRSYNGVVATDEGTGKIINKTAENKSKFIFTIPLRKTANLKTKFLIDEGVFKVIDYPHYLESYYYLTKNMNAIDFN